MGYVHLPIPTWVAWWAMYTSLYTPGYTPWVYTILPVYTLGYTLGIHHPPAVYHVLHSVYSVSGNEALGSKREKPLGESLSAS